MAVIDQITKAQARVLDTVVARQNDVLDLNKRAAKRLSNLPSADLPEINLPFEVPFADQINDRADQISDRIEDRVPSIKLPTVKLPAAGDLPAPGELVDNYFAFATKMTKANHQFATKLVDAWAPATPATKKKTATAKTTAKKKPAATKTAAKKTSAKK